MRRIKTLWARLPVVIGYERGPVLMSALRKRWVLLRHPHVDIRFGRHVYLGPGFSLDAPRGGHFHVSDGVEFRRDFRAELADPDARISIGAGSIFTYYVIIQCSTTIDIGERCMFGQSTIVVDGNHRFRDLDKPMLEQGYDFRAIRIEDDATITTKCTIIADVGRRAFVAANTVVAKPVAPYTLVAGGPARALPDHRPPPPPPPPP